MKPIDWLQQHSIKYRKSGEQFEIGCLNPDCPNQGQKQMYIHKDTGVYFCHRCGVKGNNLRQLEFKAGLIKYQDPVKSKHIYISEKDIADMQQLLFNSNGAMSFLRERGLLDSTITQFKLGLKLINENRAITIPYFDKANNCTGIKYYFYERPKGLPKIKFEKDSKVQPFNLNRIDLTQDLIVTEGELDAMSMWQYGYMNVVSMPNGAQGINGWTEDIYSAPTFTLCLDNDVAGATGTEELGKKLGLSRCKRMHPPLKDINECLQLGVPKEEIEKRYVGAEPMFHAPVTDISEYRDKAEEAIKDPDSFKGVSTGWSSFDNLIGGIREGELTVSSGITGHGKTTFAMAMIGNLIKSNMKCLIISPEMQEQDLLLELANNYYKKKIDRVEQLDNFIGAYKDKVFIANVFDQWTNKDEKSILDQVFDIIEYSIKHKGVQFVLIDHLRLFLNPKTQDGERFSIDEFMKKAVHTVITTKAHIWLVVQPKNLPSNQRKVTKHDLKGSGNIGQDTHNIVLIHRHIDSKKKNNLVEIEVAKCRSTSGTEGSVVLDFDMNSKANYYEGSKNANTSRT